MSSNLHYNEFTRPDQWDRNSKELEVALKNMSSNLHYNEFTTPDQWDRNSTELEVARNP